MSAAGDRSVLKLPIEAGRGVETPRRGAKVSVRLSVATDNGTVLNATAGDEPLRLSLDGTDLGVGLRQALLSMVRGERARVRTTAALARSPLLLDGGSEAVAVDVSLLSFEQPRSVGNMEAAELLDHVTAAKEAANAAFKSGDVATACPEYERGWHMLRLLRRDDLSTAQLDDAAALELALRMNAAACALRGGDAARSLDHADASVSCRRRRRRRTSGARRRSPRSEEGGGGRGVPGRD